MRYEPPTGPPLMVCGAGKLEGGKKLCCAAVILCLSLPFGFVGLGGLLLVENPGVNRTCLATLLCIACLLGFFSVSRVLRYGHLTRIELYADRILVYETSWSPFEFHFSEVKNVCWDDRGRYASVNGYDIDSKHFTSEEEAQVFAARANEALRAYRERETKP